MRTTSQQSEADVHTLAPSWLSVYAVLCSKCFALAVVSMAATCKRMPWELLCGFLLACSCMYVQVMETLVGR